MTSWTMPHRAEDRDHAFFWSDMDGPDDANDFFGHFVDFDDSSMNAGEGINLDQAVPRLPESLMLDHPSESHGSSTADEFDFLSSSSHVGPTSTNGGHDIDPSALMANHDQENSNGDFDQHEFLGRTSISDSDLPKVEGICLTSPTKAKHSVSQPTSPTPPKAAANRKTTNKFVEAVQSTIRKATTRRKPRKPLPERADSPAGDEPLKAPRQRPRTAGAGNKKAAQRPQSVSNGEGFIHGACDDPFNETPPVPQHANMRYYHQNGVSSPLESPAIKSEPGSFHTDHSTSQMPPDVHHWQHQASSVPTHSGQWNGSGMVTPNADSWFEYSMMVQNGEYVNQKNAEHFNMATHSQHGQLPYEYHPHGLPDTSTSGLMIQMPQPRQVQPTVVHDISMNAHTQLPPPPPIPASDRQHRPPRAPSSGARHLSVSPVRNKSRAPSASPTRTTPTAAQKRHSSGGSISSNRSSSGRLPASMPGTPCSVRKRRSRETSSGSVGGGLDVGFVNFTPSDGGMLMGGVAPSGSSKTKARREKEASDRRRKLSEAAIKAVAAAGGDVDSLMQQGFQF